MSLQPYIRQGDEHQRLEWIGATELAVILDSVATGGQLAVVDFKGRRGDASPVHIHSHDDEAFLLLEGAVTVWVGDKRAQLLPDGIGFLPRQLPHAYRLDADSRMLVFSIPAGQEEFYRLAGWDLSQPKPEGWRISPDTLRKGAEQYGITIAGPPHGLDD
jgi:quercetin dioxygenase-like cupin family protein